MTDLSKIKLNYRHDKEDKRDWNAGLLVPTEMPLQRNYSVWPDTPIYNQGLSPDCVGYCGAGVKTDEEYLQHGKKYLFNGRWLYDECKKIDGMPDVDGSSLRFAMQILQQTGMRQLVLPCQKREADSFWQIGSYFRLDASSLDDFIKQVIAQRGSIAIGTWWYRSWMNVGEVFPKPDIKNGAHAIKVTGWRDDPPIGWEFINSWGKLLWGKAGKAIMPYDMFRGAVIGDGADVWKLVDK
jgi:hypothetical protein